MTFYMLIGSPINIHFLASFRVISNIFNLPAVCQSKQLTHPYIAAVYLARLAIHLAGHKKRWPSQSGPINKTINRR